jgi:hypothetical protein
VQGKGYSYNLNNKIDATKLCEVLNGYEAQIENLHELMDIENQLKIITMDMAIIKHDLDNIKNRLEQIQ